MDSNGPTRQQLTEQAADWLVRLDAGIADPEAFEAWRAADPRHASVFAQVAAAWKRTGELRGSVTPPVTTPVTEAAPLVGRRMLLRGIAASGVGVIGLGATALVLTTRRASAETARGERRTLALPDGSRIELNTDSRIEWRFGERRELWLERGEASFAIADDLTRPLLLEAGALRAAIDPGRYNLRRDVDDTRLTVFSGRARLILAGSTATAEAGSQAEARGGALTVRQLAPDRLDSIAAWRRGELHLDGMTLEQAAAEYSRYLARPIVVADPRAAQMRLGGRFLIDEPSDFLRALAEGFAIESRNEGDRIVLRQRGAAAAVAPQQKN
jgi:transmembrane sensor